MPQNTNPSLLTALGIQIMPSEHTTHAEHTHAGHIVATMPVDERTMHPYGMLSGGASVALAESLAGYGSSLYCQEDEFPSGIQISANHVATASAGEFLTATGNLVHKGRLTHVWNIDITNSHEKLISTVRVTNMIVRKNNA